MIEVRQWSFLEFDCEACSDGKQLQLAGLCRGDRRFKDDAYIITSLIISSNGRSIVTESGTHYLLRGEPSTHWVQDKLAAGEKIDSENPLGTFFKHRKVSGE